MLRILLACAVLLLSAGTSLAQSHCSVEVFEADVPRALEACTDILKNATLSDGERVGALKIRARAFHRLDSLDAAIEDYETALRLAPDDPELYLRRGWTAFDERKPELVFKLARRALELKPGDADVYHLIGATHADEKRYEEAMAAYDEAVKLKPQEPLLRSNRMRLFKALRRHADALKEAEFILNLPPELITKPRAIDFLRKRTTLRIAAGIERAGLLVSMGRVGDAQRAADQAVLADPDAQTFAARASLNFTLAPTDLDSPEFRRVQEDVSRSIALDPDFWLSRDLQGRIHFYKRRYEEAEREFARGIELFSINGSMRWWRAMMLKRLGHVDEAATEAISAFDVDPGFMLGKIEMLHARGYLHVSGSDAEIAAALKDAVRACMLDRDCW